MTIAVNVERKSLILTDMLENKFLCSSVVPRLYISLSPEHSFLLSAWIFCHSWFESSSLSLCYSMDAGRIWIVQGKLHCSQNYGTHPKILSSLLAAPPFHLVALPTYTQGLLSILPSHFKYCFITCCKLVNWHQFLSSKLYTPFKMSFI